MVHSVRIGINIGKDVLVLKKALLIILIILLIGVFVFSGIKVAQILINYRNIDALYDKAANEFVKKFVVNHLDEKVRAIEDSTK